MLSAVLQSPQEPPTQVIVMFETLELLAVMIVPRPYWSGVGGAVTKVASCPEPWRKHHGLSVTVSLKVPGLRVSRYCFCCDASVMAASAARIVGKVAPPGSTWTLLPFPASRTGAPYVAFRSWWGDRVCGSVAMCPPRGRRARCAAILLR